MATEIKLHPWSCITSAAAKVMQIKEQDVIDRIGHNGLKYAAFHDQEVIEVALQLGYTVTPFQLGPQLLINGEAKQIPIPAKRRAEFEKRLWGGRDILQGQGPVHRHAFAYDGGTIFNPDDGITYQPCVNIVDELMVRFKFYAQQLLIFNRFDDNGL